MRILIGTDSYLPHVSGAGRFTQRLAEALARHGHQVHLACPSADGSPRVEKHNGVVVHRFRSRPSVLHEDLRISLPWEASLEGEELLALVRPDVVHVQSHFGVGRGLANAAARAGTPLVATNHFMPENVVGYLPLPPSARRALARWSWHDLETVFSQADLVTAPTPRAVGLLEASTQLRQTVAISCGIDVQRYAQAAETARPGSVPTVLFVGRLDPEKRVDELIRAVAALPDTVPARLDVVGQGRERDELTRLASELGIAHRVSFRGLVSDDELLLAYGSCDVFCMPGVAELQSIVTLEAMSAGKPIVAADAMALPHLVHPGRNGWLFRPGDVGQLSVQLATLLTDAGLRQRMGAVSRQIVSGHSQEATTAQYLDVYSWAAERVPAPLLQAA
jgi:glycosyltransferase involved in cell wall biosynthesis